MGHKFLGPPVTCSVVRLLPPRAAPSFLPLEAATSPPPATASPHRPLFSHGPPSLSPVATPSVTSGMLALLPHAVAGREIAAARLTPGPSLFPSSSRYPSRSGRLPSSSTTHSPDRALELIRFLSWRHSHKHLSRTSATRLPLHSTGTPAGPRDAPKLESFEPCFGEAETIDLVN